MKKIDSISHFALSIFVDDNGTYFLIDTDCYPPKIIDSDTDLAKLGKRAFELKYDELCGFGRISDSHILINTQKRKKAGCKPKTLYLPLCADDTKPLINLLFLGEYEDTSELVISGGDIPSAIAEVPYLFMYDSIIYDFVGMEEYERGIIREYLDARGTKGLNIYRDNIIEIILDMFITELYGVKPPYQKYKVGGDNTNTKEYAFGYTMSERKAVRDMNGNKIDDDDLTHHGFDFATYGLGIMRTSDYLVTDHYVFSIN